MSEWKEFKLKEVSLKITKGTTPSTLGSQFVQGGINFIKAEAVTKEGTIDTSKFHFIDEITHHKLKRSQLEKDDILFSMAGVALGKTALVEDKHLPANTNQALALIRIDKLILNPKFVRYYLSQNKIVEFINSSTSQSAQPNINLAEIGELKVKSPSLPTQTAIAEILSSLDDKIELNNKINQELETLAQTLFKQWFIDFEFLNESGEPYKSSGGEMVESEFGEIPKGWEDGTLGNVISKENLKVKNSESIVNKVYSAVKTSELVLSDEYFTKKVYSKSIDNYYVVKNHWFAYNPSRINIGSIGLNKSEIGAVSPVYVVFSTKKHFHFFIEYFLQLENTKNAIIQRCSGTVRQALNYEGLSSIPLNIPNDKLVIMFNDFVEKNSEHIRLIANETQELINLRDSLLPKIITGELEINEIKN
jgi:type I restriction enzyme S subunit